MGICDSDIDIINEVGYIAVIEEVTVDLEKNPNIEMNLKAKFFINFMAIYVK